MPKEQCSSCKKVFKEPEHLADHIRSTRHVQRAPITVARTVCTQFRCCDCNREFVHQTALMDHLRDKLHRPKARAPPQKNIPCGRCNKSFASKKAANRHRTSPIHRPFCAPLWCIDSNICKKIFSTPSALVLHLESGSCPSKLTRTKLNDIIVQHDMHCAITHPGALTSSSDCMMPNSWGTILTPSSSSLSLLEQSGCYNSPNSDLSPDEDWVLLSLDEVSLSSGTVQSMCLEGDSIQSIASASPSTLFICPLCPPTSNRFRTAKDLQSHETSPIHAPKIFHCPSLPSVGNGEGARKPATRSFSTFSGLAMHIESGACGKRMFQQILSEINDKLKGVGLQEIRLVT